MSLFITFEGAEGSGKSTQARLLYEHLQAQGFPVILTREPGGTRIGDLIRRILLDLQHTEMLPATETLLFLAARAQIVGEVIRPYLDVGGIVLCDRYVDSTYAHQGYGLGKDLDELRAITSIATGNLMPDLTIYLDINPEEGLERKQAIRRQNAPAVAQRRSDSKNNPEWNRLDARDLAYHQRVSQGYAELMAQDPGRWKRFDARQSIDDLAREISEAVTPFLSRVARLEETS
jgi:thymidylate kinase